MFTLPWFWPVAVAPLFGSFLSVLVTRLPTGAPIVWDRSRCDACRHELTARDLVPLLSWLAERGRCRFCGIAIGALYPGLEVAATLLAVWAATTASGWLLVASCCLAWSLLTLAVIDARHFLLPDALTLPLLALGLVVAEVQDPARLPAHGLGAAAGFFGFCGLRWAYRRYRGRDGLGLGDAKLLAAAGAWVSWEGLPSVIFIGAMLTLAYALLCLPGRRSFAERVPFGTGLCGAIWLVWLYGPLFYG